MSTTTLRPGRFYLPGVIEPPVDGFTDGETWNGAACPYFTKNIAKLIVKRWTADDVTHQLEPGMTIEQPTAWYDEKSDQFVFLGREYDENNEPRLYPVDDFSPVEIEGQKLYPIGRQAWMWEQEQETE